MLSYALPLFPFLFEWVERKIKAKIQRRVGPPLLQPVYDFIKLLSKETIIPETTNFLFALPPLLIFLIDSVAIFIAYLKPPFALLILLALFATELLMKALLARMAKSPFTIYGAGRIGAMKMALEPAFPLSFLAPAFIFNFELNWPSAAVLFLPLAFLASMAELELPPFDLPTAESEIATGWKAELSGKLLAFVNYAEDAKKFTISLMLASMLGPGLLIFKSLLIFSIMVALSYSLPRFHIDRVMRFLALVNILSLAEVIGCLSWVYLHA